MDILQEYNITLSSIRRNITARFRDILNSQDVFQNMTLRYPYGNAPSPPHPPPSRRRELSATSSPPPNWSTHTGMECDIQDTSNIYTPTPFTIDDCALHLLDLGYTVFEANSTTCSDHLAAETKRDEHGDETKRKGERRERGLKK